MFSLSYILIFEILQICSSSLIGFFYFCNKAPLCLKKAHEYIKEIQDCDPNEKDNRSSENPNSQEKRSSSFAALLRNIRNKIIITQFIFLDPFILYYSFYITFAILGMFNPVFIAILLLDIFLRLV